MQAFRLNESWLLELITLVKGQAASAFVYPIIYPIVN
jgi:hypothetical protein